MTLLGVLSSLYLISVWVIRGVMVIYVPLRRSPASANSWLLLIFFQPWVGLILYLLIGRPYLPKGRKAKIRQLPHVLKRLAQRFEKHPHITHPEVSPPLRPAVALAAGLGHMPILGNNKVELLSKYDETICSIIADIDQAKSTVHMLYYIFAIDNTTQPVIDALRRAVKRNVKVRVLIDALGSRAWRKELTSQLTGLGAEVHQMLPVNLLRRKTGRFDMRNHRKIVVIDGRIGYTGSQNMVEAQFKEDITYEELVVRLTGPIVLELQFVLVADWMMESNEVLDTPEIFPDPEETGTVAAQLLPSGPGMANRNNQCLIVDLIHAAHSRVIITTPYFIPDEPLLQALRTAVLRGVEVHLVVSKKEDQMLVSLAQKSYYQEILEIGVKIHLYRDNFLHAKHLSIDDSLCLIGSSNMDIRSFALNAEVSVLFYDTEVTAKLHEQEARYFKNCEELTLEVWETRSRIKKTAQSLARLMSPLL